MIRTRHLTLVLTLAVATMSGCRSPSQASAPIPAMLLGEFVDDYTGRHTVSESDWLQHPRSRYYIVLWSPEQQYLIAQNDWANKSDAGKFGINMRNFDPDELGSLRLRRFDGADSWTYLD